MKERMNIDAAEPGIYKAMNAAEKEMAGFTIEKKLAELIKLRTSQINGCGYCVNYHAGDARKAGETEQRVYAISAWWETPFYTEAERAALKLAEEVTNIKEAGLREETFQNARKYFSEQEIAQLIFITTVTNSWNRIAISMHMVAA
ncbi:alkylhydroperoxidase [Niastella koreensis]|uniref:Alkylhydroperoxidase like protein, AhpD family n=2 Tax=Niastella koreensis TaxID=354356 RepID=G8TI47_NIAKG|nr:carboxymuconolactone decarboxylase family protein [Niastella koreensis]AEV99650.1 alkylhydroperoxidase like protein, AhpD family [Niastella koreensis GR20-10]OQP49898.1 alkylhydroperoxidase [Niastella koreensis]